MGGWRDWGVGRGGLVMVAEGPILQPGSGGETFFFSLSSGERGDLHLKNFHHRTECRVSSCTRVDVIEE